MIECKNSELIISFPGIHDSAPLRLYFTPIDAFDDQIPFKFAADRPLFLTRLGRFIIHFRPSLNAVPYAILMSVEGRNAITSDHSAQLTRMPQNYFASPPQGGVDGFFLDGMVHPFIAGDDESLVTDLLRLKIYPAKKEFIERWQVIRCGWDPHINGLTLQHGGRRECEPIYEDMCCIGDWDKTQCEEITLLLASARS